MSRCITWCSVCMVAVIFCSTLEPSQSQGCSTEKTENATIDLKVALSKGIRGADPVHVASWEACINTCCFGHRISGNKECNLVVFKPHKRGGSPNCYLFHCPTEGACPLKQAEGLVTYRTIKDPVVPKPTSSLNKTLGLIVNGSFASPKAVVIDTPTTSPKWPGPSPKSPASKMMKVVLGQTEKPVDKIHRHSHHPGGEGAKPSENVDSLLKHPTINSVTPTKTPQNLLPNIQSTVKLPAVTPSNQTRSVATVSPSNATATRHAASDYGNTYVATVSPRGGSPALQPTATPQVKASSLSPSPPTLSKVSSATLHKARLSHGQLSRHSDPLNRAPGEKHDPYLGERSVLVAVLLFGVIFLLLAQVVIGRKLLESLRHRRYSRLDYLINGMYANV
ncbi:MANSC domain-containing protein 1 [Heteronotia binoei]|uniref:MANSC domain-containing protein 1 n=1 Tax=Heteronotia binoei TaxID=13085 RepID=UPI002930772C|nr:MANSC domain-containing protein 1 [Heteronotia binoei]XP_060109896.1 MANSC domain-containing protein 1 [Heteronotia binoei]XP_060109897.1 MANSC domain-containing protein 1 [Heteronotia binoei]